MDVLFDGRRSAPPDLREAAIRQLRAAFRRFAWLVVRVRVRMTEVSGPRGVIDTQCQVSLDTALGRTLRVESVAGDRQAALGLAVGRASAALARSLRRLQAIPRSRSRRGIASAPRTAKGSREGS